MISADHPLLLIGCGNMGSAMLAGWRSTSCLKAEEVIVIHRRQDALQSLQTQWGVRGYLSLDDLPKSIQPSAICLAIKPTMLEPLLQQIRTRYGTQCPLALSVAAGKTLAFFAEHLGASIPVIRAMPNTPSQVGEGMTSCIANHHVNDQQKTAITQLMNAVGKTLWLDDESQMDIATAIAGSGPAYIFYLIECLVNAATQHNLSQAAATQLAIQTIKGASILAEQSKSSPSQLREQVTSPNGTTQAALDVFMQTNAPCFSSIIAEAIDRAAQRSKELSGVS